MIPFIKSPLYSTLCLVPCSTPHSTLVSQTIGAWFAPGGSLVRACAAGALRTGGAASGCTGTQCGWQPGALYVHGTAPAAPPIVPALQPNTVRPVQRTACNTRRPNTRLRCRTLLHPTPSLSPQAADAPPCAPRPSAFARGCAALLRKACRPARAEAGRARCSGSGGDRAARLSAALHRIPRRCGGRTRRTPRRCSRSRSLRGRCAARPLPRAASAGCAPAAAHRCCVWPIRARRLCQWCEGGRRGSAGWGVLLWGVLWRSPGVGCRASGDDERDQDQRGGWRRRL